MEIVLERRRVRNFVDSERWNEKMINFTAFILSWRFIGPPDLFEIDSAVDFPI